MKDALGAVQSLVVFGGTSEIAVATARALTASRGVKIVLAGRDGRALEEVADDLRRGRECDTATVLFDARHLDDHAAAVGEAFEQAGGDVDVVLVAFGVLGDNAEARRDVRSAVEVGTVNYLGAMSVVLLAAQRLEAQGHGTIVVLSSVAGERPRRSNYIYGSSKAGIDALAQGLADDLAGTGVDVVVVRPGFVHSKMTAGMKPAPLATTPDAVAVAIKEAIARGGSRTLWVPGALRFVMAVLRHLPRPLFRRLNL